MDLSIYTFPSLKHYSVIEIIPELLEKTKGENLDKGIEMAAKSFFEGFKIPENCKNTWKENALNYACTIIFGDNKQLPFEDSKRVCGMIFQYILILKPMKNLTEKQKRLKKARAFLNKYFHPGEWGDKWKDEDVEVKTLARIIKL